MYSKWLENPKLTSNKKICWSCNWQISVRKHCNSYCNSVGLCSDHRPALILEIGQFHSYSANSQCDMSGLNFKPSQQNFFLNDFLIGTNWWIVIYLGKLKRSFVLQQNLETGLAHLHQNSHGTLHTTRIEIDNPHAYHPLPLMSSINVETKPLPPYLVVIL